MRDGEGLDFDVADGETLSGAEKLEGWGVLVLPQDGPAGQRSYVHRDGAGAFLVESRGQSGQTADVIGVLVGDQDGVEVRRGFPDGLEPLGQLTAAETSVYQDAGAPGSDQRGVAPAAAAQHCDA
jgi:hypothetical protein